MRKIMIICIAIFLLLSCLGGYFYWKDKQSNILTISWKAVVSGEQNRSTAIYLILRGYLNEDIKIGDYIGRWEYGSFFQKYENFPMGTIGVCYTSGLSGFRHIIAVRDTSGISLQYRSWDADMFALEKDHTKGFVQQRFINLPANVTIRGDQPSFYSEEK